MKKKLVAVVLSLTVCLGTGLEAGAAAFYSGEESDIFTSGAELEVPEIPVEEDFWGNELQGEPEETAEEETDDFFVEEEPGEIADEFTAGEQDGETVTADLTGGILVSADAWEAAETGFKLHKSETEYYTEADGLVLISTEYKAVTHTGYYLFDEEGLLVTGKKAVKAGTLGVKADTEFYFTDKDHAVVYSEFTGEAATPYSSTLGSQVLNDWVWAGDAFSFYDENGQYMTVSKLNEIYKQSGKYTGYFKIAGEYYCLDLNGKPRTGNITLTAGSGSAKYYFQPSTETGDDIPGRMFHEGWRTAIGARGERWLYFNQGVTNPADIGKLLERGMIATRLDIDKMGNVTYLIDKYGYILKNTMKKAANGAYYCTNKDGAVYKDKLVKYNNARYYFTGNGQRAAWKNGWYRCPGAANRYYYFGSTAGKIVEKTGWQGIKNPSGDFQGWFYFNTAGNHYVDKMTSTGYYFTKKGTLAGGIVTVNGKKYLFAESDANTHRGKMYKNAIVYYNKKYYHASADGSLTQSGWAKAGDNWYYLNNYKAVTKKFMKKDGVNGYLDSSGKFTTGWVIVSNVSNKIRYIDPDGDGYLKNGSKWIDGLLYYFDSNGYRINDLTNIYGGPYYFEVDRINGVMTVYDSSRKVPVKSIRVSVGRWETPTPTGTYSLTRYSRWQPLMGPSWGQYGTHVDGAGQGGIFVHSVAGSAPNSYSVPIGEYNKLGSPASHGCIRACVADAKWVYDHSSGGTIRIFDGKYNSNEALKGPLGRRPLVRATGSFDPTDPEV